MMVAAVVTVVTREVARAEVARAVVARVSRILAHRSW
jgi:hypothetical protein